MIEEWRFPTYTVGAIRDQYRPSSESSPLAHLLNLAGGQAEQAGFGLPGEQTFWESTPAKQAVITLEPFEIEDAVSAVRDEFERAREAIS